MSRAWTIAQALKRTLFRYVSRAWTIALALKRTLFRYVSRAWTIALLLCLVVIIATFIWRNGTAFWSNHDSLSWQACVYGDAPCSTAAATWMLGAFGLLTFAAAWQTVIWAKRAYNIEIEPKLGQSVCPRQDSEEHPNDKEVFLLSSNQVVFRPPAGSTKQSVATEFQSYPHAFENLGRSALADVKVFMHIRDRTGKTSDPILVSVGNVKCDQEVHLVLHVWRRFDVVEVMWSEATERGTPIGFFPESPLRKEVEIELESAQIDLPLAPQAPSPPRPRARPPTRTTHQKTVAEAALPVEKPEAQTETDEKKIKTE